MLKVVQRVLACLKRRAQAFGAILTILVVQRKKSIRILTYLYL
jgi:hypothetical protein